MAVEEAKQLAEEVQRVDICRRPEEKSPSNSKQNSKTRSSEEEMSVASTWGQNW